ncbi:NAD(P)/FAD-dependent oxidoreductase [Methylobacillus sp.]|uniref:NAD(P)/FAD-dependent oxidoreductase n=1 Tax=Methylobacillus sp. TaxID=56818 RepID=UPI002FE19FDC
MTKSSSNLVSNQKFDIVVVGGGSAGISVTASLLKRDSNLRIGIIEPGEFHYYQPAWTLVGSGDFDIKKTRRPMQDVIPSFATWIKSRVSSLIPSQNAVELSDGEKIYYDQLIVCPGLRLAWEKIEGLEATLGKNGVTSNYAYDFAPYTKELISKLKNGKAIFTQPPMPIKCAGAPQKAMYLSCDYWLRHHTLKSINVEFYNAGAVLFGVAEFVPPLMKYVEKYDAKLNFNSNLVKIDGQAKKAWFEVKEADGSIRKIEREFDMIHVVPPQVPHDFVANSPLADPKGWCLVDNKTLQSPNFPNVFSLGDITSTPNAKTAAATRKQVVIVAKNIISLRKNQPLESFYDGYGSCPLTVQQGKIVLAEFGYGGKLLPSFPLDPTKPRRSAWALKASILPRFYWAGMLKGTEWMTRCTDS